MIGSCKEKRTARSGYKSDGAGDRGCQEEREAEKEMEGLRGRSVKNQKHQPQRGDRSS